jgi:hypothetical protein
LTKCYYADQVKEEEMGKKWIRVAVAKTWTDETTKGM